MNLRDFGLAKATFAEVIPYQRRSRPLMAINPRCTQNRLCGSRHAIACYRQLSALKKGDRC